MSVGMMMNSFLPARLGDFTRAYLIGEAESDSKVYVLGTVAVEKVADLLFLLLSLMVLLSQMALPEWLSGSARGMALMLAHFSAVFCTVGLAKRFYLAHGWFVAGLTIIMASFFTFVMLVSGQTILSLLSAILIGISFGLYYYNKLPARFFWEILAHR